MIRRRDFLAGSAALATAAIIKPKLSYAAATDAAKKWVDNEFQPSTLTKDQQMAEMEWFIKASKPYEGMTINMVSEPLTVHDYEAKQLAQAFKEMTGITVNHDIIQEGDVVNKISTEMQTGHPIYDIWINDSDFIGTHPRYNDSITFTDYMAGDGKAITNPNLDLDDFIGLEFGKWIDGKVYQLPDQQFANLYWFRYDWFSKPAIRDAFKKKYGYDLGVPVNWSAYEDIADFFTNTIKEIDGQKIYGHMDYGKKDPSLGWRFTDAWLSMAGEGDKGLPNGRPVDEWGIRLDGYNPTGSSITRGGGANSPAAVYALEKYIDWLKKYAPPEAAGMTFSEAGPVPAQGHVAQQIFWYTAFTADMVKPGLPVDEWGIRVAADKCTPVGASVERGGATNSPAAVYALTKYIDWMKAYAPKEATGMTFGEAGPVPAQGQIAQQIFWYTAFTADMTKPGLPVEIGRAHV